MAIYFDLASQIGKPSVNVSVVVRPRGDKEGGILKYIVYGEKESEKRV